MSYGTAVKRLYGVPVALENIGLVVNTKLATVPKTFASAPGAGAEVPEEDVRQHRPRRPAGRGGDAYHMYPFFSGLCGYIFGTNNAGNLDPSNIGVANPKFLKNAKLIDEWNKEGLINSKVDCDDRTERLPQGQGGLLDHRPVELGHAQEERAQVHDHPVPEHRVRRRCRSSASRASW